MIRIEQIRAARALLDMSQKELALAAGISVATLNNIERGAQTDPKISTLRAIEQALETAGVQCVNHAGAVGVTLVPPSAEAKTILIIDDNTADRLLYKKWLSEGDNAYRILEAQDGKNGLATYLARQPDCIILDFMMYGMDGFQLLVSLKNERTTLPPIIFVSGIQDPSIEQKATAQGVYCYLDKQALTATRLQKHVAQALRDAHLTQRVSA